MKYVKKFEKYNEEVNYKKILTNAAVAGGLTFGNLVSANDLPKDSISTDKIPSKSLHDFIVAINNKYGNELYDVLRPIGFLKEELYEYDPSFKLKKAVEDIKSQQPNYPLNINLFYIYAGKQVPILTLDYKFTNRIHFTFTKNEVWDKNLFGLTFEF